MPLALDKSRYEVVLTGVNDVTFHVVVCDRYHVPGQQVFDF
jgi:hypothetical protein